MDYTSHGLIYTEKDIINKKSAIIFHNKYILVPATILISIINEYNEFKELEIKTSIIDALNTKQIIDVYNDIEFEILKLIKFYIVHEISTDSNKSLYKSSANLLYIFNCINISQSINNLLMGFSQIDFSHQLTTSSNTYTLTQKNENFNKLMFSSFLLLKFHDCKYVDLIDDVIKTLGIHLLKEEETWNMVTSIEEKEVVMRPKHINKLEPVASITTPFGNECFFKTINIGRISNIFGYNNCLMSVSMPLVWGCEGGGIYNVKKELIGVVINTAFQWKNELANFTLVGNFNEIFRDLLHQLHPNNNLLNNEKYISTVFDISENYVVLIEMPSSSWGTGCLVRIRNRKFILTCAHVIDTINNSAITCYWKNGKFECKVIYKNPHYNKPYDLAILSVSNDIPNNYFATCDTNSPRIGQSIYTVGFPHFSNLATRKFTPSIFEGRITNINKGLFFTDASIQAGQSGGPILNMEGKLIGICVSNSKDEQTHTIYPHINMSIPIFNIYNILDKYAKYGNINELKSLIVTDENIINQWALDIPRIISQL